MTIINQAATATTITSLTTKPTTIRAATTNIDKKKQTLVMLMI
jgi:hypothetical protein